LKRKEQKKEQSKQNKNEANLVTKESICAVCAVFSFMALLILCTKSLVFGELGIAVHEFLTGALGYFAYPLLCCAMYLSVTTLLEKRLVKNRKAFACVAASLLCAVCIVHIALTWSLFDGEEYLQACYNAGVSFPAATPAGWLGGIVVSAVVTLSSKIGALIVFSVGMLFFGYLAYIQMKKRENLLQGEQPQNTVQSNAQNEMEMPVEISVGGVEQRQVLQAAQQNYSEQTAFDGVGMEMPYGQDYRRQSTRLLFLRIATEATIFWSCNRFMKRWRKARI
jgi:hypothetical protein